MRWMLIVMLLAVGCGGTTQPECCPGAVSERDNLLIFADPRGNEVLATQCACANGLTRNFPSDASCDTVRQQWAEWSAQSCK